MIFVVVVQTEFSIRTRGFRREMVGGLDGVVVAEQHDAVDASVWMSLDDETLDDISREIHGFHHGHIWRSRTGF